MHKNGKNHGFLVKAMVFTSALSAQTLSFQSALQSLFDISALDIFDIFFERLTLKIRDFFLKIRKISVSAPTHFAASA